jgi:hypothetical protein
MVSKIFTILEGIKKASNITKTTSSDSVDKIVNEVKDGNINPIEAYIVLDYLAKVTSEALGSIKAVTLDHIEKDGENVAFGVLLQVYPRKNIAYKEDKDWADTKRKMKVFEDALKVREEFIKRIIEEALVADKESPIGFTNTIVIKPNIIS